MGRIHRCPHVCNSFVHIRFATFNLHGFRRSDHHDLARSTFKDVSTKNLDYPEALWDAWINFEYAHGSLASLEDAMARIERARTRVEARRMKVCCTVDTLTAT